jgi:hypothetical protein
VASTGARRRLRGDVCTSEKALGLVEGASATRSQYPFCRRAPFVLEALKEWPQVFEANGDAVIRLTVLPNVARDRVLEDLLEQLTKLNAALQSAAARTSPAPSAVAVGA